MQRIIISWPKSQRLMLDNTRYRLRLIQLRILGRLHCGLLTPKLSHPFAVLRINLAILLLALGMCSETNHLLLYLYQDKPLRFTSKDFKFQRIFPLGHQLLKWTQPPSAFEWSRAC